MGNPKLCIKGHQNGLLVERCQMCHEPLTDNAQLLASFDHNNGGDKYGLSWETDPIGLKWQTAIPIPGKHHDVDIHEFLGYALLIKELTNQCYLDDTHLRFDDMLFFLRGGYDFAAQFYPDRPGRRRVRVFGGLGHGKRPKQRLRTWLRRLLEKASALGRHRIDVLVVDEANSGTGVRTIIKTIKEELESWCPNLIAIDIRFHFYMACPDGTSFDPESFSAFLLRNQRRRYRFGTVLVTNEFRIFSGPILTYDADLFSGLKKLTNGTSEVERYEILRYQAPSVSLNCPSLHNRAYSLIPGCQSMDNAISFLIESILSRREDQEFGQLKAQVASNGCDFCRNLMGHLESSIPLWSSYQLFGAGIDECIRKRAYYLWESRKHDATGSPVRDWFEAERMELASPRGG